MYLHGFLSLPTTGLSPIEALAAQIVQRFGIDIDRTPPHVRTVLEQALAEGLDDALLMQRVLSVCCVGETTFLRHPEHLAGLRRLAPRLPSATEGAPLRVWSAGCATGEEAYSLAAVLEPVLPGGVSVIGSDLNADFISCARNGEYRPWSTRGVQLDDPQVANWLHVDGALVKVHKSLRERVRFFICNLMLDVYPTDLDVIFCRNVLLYFHPGAVAAIFSRFAASLRVGGVLFLGGGDPWPTDRKCWAEEVDAGVVYFRRQEEARSVAKANLLRETRATSPLPRPPAPIKKSETETDAFMMARALAAQGQFDAALRILEDLIEQHPLLVAPHILMAMVASEALDPSRAVVAARRACFLVPESPVAQFLFAQALFALGEKNQAEHHRKIAAEQIANLPESGQELLHGEGLTIRQLRKMIDGHARIIRSERTGE